MESTSSTHGRTQPSSRQKLYTDSGEYKRRTEGRVVRLYFFGWGDRLHISLPPPAESVIFLKVWAGVKRKRDDNYFAKPPLFFDYLFSFSPQKKSSSRRKKE
jgi:hypothetical protein